MSFPHHCKICPMKFPSAEDLQIHDEVHSVNSYASSYDLNSNSEPLFNEFLTAFFPDLNDSYIPPLNEFSVPDHHDSTSAEWDDPSSVSSSEDDVTYTTLTNVKFPNEESEKIQSESSNTINLGRSMAIRTLSSPDGNHIPSNVFIKKFSTIRFLNPSNIQTAQVSPKASLNGDVLKPVYVARRPPSVAMIQHHYGDDRSSRHSQYNTSVLHPTILTKCLPSFTMVNIQNRNNSSESVGVPDDEKVTDTVTPNRFGISEEDSNKATIAKKILKKSRRSTIGEKPYSCEVCDKRFAFVKKFIAHKRIHTVGKLFSCSLCFKRFGYSYKLNQHMRLHAAKAKSLEKCDMCKKTYQNLGRLRRHQCKGLKKNLSSERRSYACTVCSRTFSRINYLNLHKRSHEDKNREPRNEIQDQFIPMESISNPL